MADCASSDQLRPAFLPPPAKRLSDMSASDILASEYRSRQEDNEDNVKAK
jgi:hypothetical protein